MSSPPRTRAPRSWLERLAFPFLPADPTIEVPIVEALGGGETARDVPPGAIVWVEQPARGGEKLARSLGSALRRERTLQRLRRGSPAGTAVHRLPPPATLRLGSREALRSLMLGGALVEAPGPTAGDRILDAVLRDAGAALIAPSLRRRSGGVWTARVQTVDGRPGVLRMAPRSSEGNPLDGASALAALSGGALPVPAPLGAGSVAGAAWTLESLLPGRRPRRLTRRLARDAALFCAALPVTGGSPAAHLEDLSTLADRLPGFAQRLRAAAQEVADALGALPAVMRHGDLWGGNLLAARGRLSGVVDWDAWHQAGAPGADLLHLVAMDLAGRGRRTFRDVWRAAPWRSESFAGMGRPVWAAIGARPDRAGLEGIALAWWAGHAAATLRRVPEAAEDPRWLARVIEPVLGPAGAEGGTERP